MEITDMTIPENLPQLIKLCDSVKMEFFEDKEVWRLTINTKIDPYNPLVIQDTNLITAITKGCKCMEILNS
jgi:hypothetical protein